MPLYDVEHTTPLLTDPALQQKLAQALTSLHAARFHTPSFFINVRFHDLSTGAMPTYRGGHPVRYNRVLIRTRVSENRSKAAYDAHCRDVVRVWGEVVGGEELRTVWVMGALTTAVEAGFERPVAGTEVDWLKGHLPAFQRLADGGDEEFARLMEELKTREDFKGVWE